MHYELYEASALFEHKFWLQVLGDHARFIFNALSPKETEEIQKAQYFIQIFDNLLQQARYDLKEKELQAFNQQAYYQAQQIRAFKLDLICKHLVGDILIELSPSFINHMVNEVEEYLKVLHCLLMNQLPAVHPIHYHLVWLLDAAGHAAGIEGGLDMTEKMLQERSEKFVNIFEDFYIKAAEISGYLRTNLKEFPALGRFNQQVAREIEAFQVFLKDMEKLVEENKALGTLYPLLLDHMDREECYYLIKLSRVSAVEKPECDPTRPRVQM